MYNEMYNEMCRHWMHGCLQVEVERYFVAMGSFLPSFHKAYWVGLQAEYPGGPEGAHAGCSQLCNCVSICAVF
jgi:hypothetical protein